MLDYQLLKGWKGIFSPLFPSQDPPTALRSASEIVSSSKRYMQEDGRYWGRRAWANSTRSIGFDSSIEAPLWLWDAFICWARCCRKVQKFGALKNSYISKLADGIIGDFLEKSPKFLFWNLLIDPSATKALYAERCSSHWAVKSLMCDDEPTRSIGFDGTYAPAAMENRHFDMLWDWTNEWWYLMAVCSSGWFLMQRQNRWPFVLLW